MAETTYYCVEYQCWVHDTRLAEVLSDDGCTLTARTEGDR
jgi:hypothetical protein